MGVRWLCDGRAMAFAMGVRWACDAHVPLCRIPSSHGIRRGDVVVLCRLKVDVEHEPLVLGWRVVRCAREREQQQQQPSAHGAACGHELGVGEKHEDGVFRRAEDGGRCSSAS